MNENTITIAVEAPLMAAAERIVSLTPNIRLIRAESKCSALALLQKENFKDKAIHFEADAVLCLSSNQQPETFVRNPAQTPQEVKDFFLHIITAVVNTPQIV